MTTKLSPEIDRLVERQLRNWEIARAQRLADEVKPKVYEFIAISRQVGAGGSEIATKVGAELGWPVLDREILHAMSDSNTLRERLYEEMDEHDLNWVQVALESLQLREPHPHDYFSRLAGTLLTIVRQGHAVFVGRAADLVLPQDFGLRVRVVAPLPERIRRHGMTHYLDERLAREAVVRIDSERAEFIRKHFRCEVDDPLRFDLVLNTGRLTIRSAVNLVLAAVRERMATRPTG